MNSPSSRNKGRRNLPAVGATFRRFMDARVVFESHPACYARGELCAQSRAIANLTPIRRFPAAPRSSLNCRKCAHLPGGRTIACAPNWVERFAQSREWIRAFACQMQLRRPEWGLLSLNGNSLTWNVFSWPAESHANHSVVLFVLDIQPLDATEMDLRCGE